MSARPGWLRSPTIRVKLTLGFVAAMSVVLAITGAFLYLRFAGELDRTIELGLRSQVEAVRTLVAQTDNGLRESGRGLATRSRSFAQVLYRGAVVDFTPPLTTPLLDAATLARASRAAITLDRTAVPGLTGQVRLRAAPVTGQDSRREVAVVGTSISDRTHALATLAALLALGGAGALLLAGVVGYVLSTVALRTVESLRARAETLSVAEPGGRLPVPRARDELWRLATTLNSMLARNDAAFERERAFLTDASHELRTPLTILRAELEIALRAGNRLPEIRRAVASAAEESERLSKLAADLLLVARADEGRGSVNDPAPVSVARLLADVAARRGPGAPERPVSVACPEELTVRGEAEWLERALGNLLDNALRHGRGPVIMCASRVKERIEIHVLDAGDGFAPAFIPRAFDRFTRGSPDGGPDGAGVGLAIARSVARAHGGDAGATNRRHSGADVWLSLPAVSTAAADGQMNGR